MNALFWLVPLFKLAASVFGSAARQMQPGPAPPIPCRQKLKSNPLSKRESSRSVGTWESADAFQLDHNGNVDAWVKNDHLGFEILYVFKGVVHKYRPDFLIRLKTGNFLVVETKGQDTDQDKTKREFLDQWVKAVNAHRGFGSWSWAVVQQPGEVVGILADASSI